MWWDSTEEEQQTVDSKVPGSSTGGGGEMTKIIFRKLFYVEKENTSLIKIPEKVFQPLRFETRSPATEGQCATNELCLIYCIILFL